MQVTEGNLSNSLPSWRVCRRKRAPVIIGFFQLRYYGAFFLSKFNLLVVFTDDLRFSDSTFVLFNPDSRFPSSTFVLFNPDSRFLSSTFVLFLHNVRFIQA